MNSIDCRNIEKETESNTDYRRVIKTVEGMQLVLMSLNVGETIPCEVHKGAGAQFIRIESGLGRLTENGKPVCKLSNGLSLLIPNGLHHCIANTSKTLPMKLYSIYTPQQHAPAHRDIRQPKNDDEKKPITKKSVVKAPRPAIKKKGLKMKLQK